MKLFCIKFYYGDHRDNVIIAAENKNKARFKFIKNYNYEEVEFISIETVEVDGYDIIVNKTV